MYAIIIILVIVGFMLLLDYFIGDPVEEALYVRMNNVGTAAERVRYHTFTANAYREGRSAAWTRKRETDDRNAAGLIDECFPGGYVLSEFEQSMVSGFDLAAKERDFRLSYFGMNDIQRFAKL